jgi:hypothetical protein
MATRKQVELSRENLSWIGKVTRELKFPPSATKASNDFLENVRTQVKPEDAAMVLAGHWKLKIQVVK